MRTILCFSAIALFARPGLVHGQQIQDIWETTWDQGSLFSSLSPSPINFTDPGTAGDADITVDDTTKNQQMDGFGGSLTDSAATTLKGLKDANSANYNSLLNTLFDTTDGAASAGLNVIRIPIGASDYSTQDYSLDDTSGDTGLNDFNIDNVPSAVFEVLNDIKAVNPNVKIIITPWSPPGWMKDGGTMNGGSLISDDIDVYANYLLKSIQGFDSKGTVPYALSVQNEPENSNGNYPTCSMPVDTMAQVGTAVRTLMDNNGYSGVKLLGYDHNWDHAADYPVQLMQQAGDAFDGVQFHCYAGEYTQMADFVSAFPDKEVYFTECTGTYGSDWWSDVKYNLDNIFIGSVENNARTGLLWNIALDGSGNPHIPTQTPCPDSGCRPIATVNSDGTFSLNQEYYALAQASRAVVPKDANGPIGQRIGVSVGGDLSWALRVSAFVTTRTDSADWNRYSLVVLNWDDSSSTTFNPVPVAATINFRGKQAAYTFPVGVTTLWWYAED